MFNLVSSLLGILGCLLLVAYLTYLAVVGDPERQDEIRAREHFREHGRWPDEEEPTGS